MSLTPVAVLAVVVAAFVQGCRWMGFALIATPAVGIVQANLLPVVVVALVILQNIYSANLELEASS